METIDKYLSTLKEVGKRRLEKYFQISILGLTDFGIVNSFLIYQSFAKNKNLLINLPNKNTKTQFYIPVILTLSLYEFIDNYIEYEFEFKEGDILQKDGKRCQITCIQDGWVTVKFNDKRNTIIKTKQEKIRKEYILTNAPLTQGKAKIKFNTYKDFFRKTLNLDNKYGLPSKFKYKSIIITDKKIVDELKEYKIKNNIIHKAFPFRYITKNGKSFDNIPIDPMIYLVNDYQTAKEYIIQNMEIRNIIFVGGNKYQGYESSISSDLLNKMYDNAVFIGSSDISQDSIPNLLKWVWTLPELNYFKYIKTKKINLKIVNNKIFEKKFQELIDLINSVEKEYNINLSKLSWLIKALMTIVIPHHRSRLLKQLDNLLGYFQKEGQEIIEDQFYEIGEYDYEDVWNKMFVKYNELIEYKKTDFSKYEMLRQIDKINYLVVPKEYIESWKEEKNNNIYEIISFNDFKELKNNYNTEKLGQLNIVFLGFYGYNHLKEIIYPEFNVILVLYEIESQSYNYSLKQLKNETFKNIKQKDRKKISGISFTQTESEETIAELLQRLLNKSEDSFHNYDYSNRNNEVNLTYKIVFNDGEELILEENKTVLLKTDSKERPEKVKNLRENDKIRVYENTTKEKLYKIASEADNQNIFQEIETLSLVWKTALIKYFHFHSLSIEELLNSLRENGISIKNTQTLKYWTDIMSEVKFPQRKKDLYVLKKITNNKLLNENFEKILSARRNFNGIMIALGKDLSDDIAEYIKTKNKGKILKRFTDNQINEMINQNAPLRTIKLIEVVNDESL